MNITTGPGYPSVRVSPTIRPPDVQLLEDAVRFRTVETEHRWNWRNIHEFYWTGLPWPTYIKSARTETPIVVDCWKYGYDLRQPCISHISHIEDGYIESRAAQPNPTQEDKPPRAGIHLLHICYDRSPFPKDILEGLAKAFGIPRVHLSVSSLYSGVCTRLRDPDTNHPIFVCRAPLDDTAVTSVLKYNPQTNVTTGYILSSSESKIHAHLIAIPTQFDLCEHPLVVPVQITEHSLEVVSSQLYSLMRKVDNVEWRAGIIRPDQQKRDYNSENARLLSGMTGGLARYKAQLQATTLRNAFIEEQLRTVDTWMPTATLQASQESTSLLMERTAYVRSNLEHLNTFSGLELRLNALNTLISRDMKGIAIKLKKDGSTMKLVAILGAIFLPSTFVSTFFSMPFFNWNAPSASEVAGHYFWLYWAVAGPMTLCTIVLVWAWMLLRNEANPIDGDNVDPQPQSKSERGQPDSKKTLDTSGKVRPWYVRLTDGSHHPSHLYDRFEKAVQSLSRRNRHIVSTNENEKSSA